MAMETKTKEHELFLAHYPELCKTLTDVENLLPHFVQAHIISVNIHQEISAKVTLNQKAEALMRYISGPLESGNTERFYTMLKIMKEHGNQATQELAKQIRSKINDMNHTSVMLTGITGAGKSSACNFLLGEKIFEIDQGMMAVTSKSASHSTMLNSRRVEVIDTPGFCEDGVSEEQSINELGKAIVLARNGLHAIAIVINVSHRFTSSQVVFLKEIELFDQLWPFMFIIFSAAKSYGATDEEQRKVVYNTYNSHKCPRHLKILLDKVGKRFMMLESTEDNQIYRTKKLKEFFEMVDSIYHTNKKVYSNQLFKQAVILYEKQKEMERKKEKEYKVKLDTLAHQMKEEIKKLKAEKEREVQLMQEKIQQEKRKEEERKEAERRALIEQTRKASENAGHIYHASQQQMRETAAVARRNPGVMFMTRNMEQTQNFNQNQSWGPPPQMGGSGDGCNIS